MARIVAGADGWEWAPIQLFSTVFYGGDILSYVRLMALGMVGSGFGMAINVLVKLVMEAPYVGWLLGAVVFVGGHLFNLAISMLGAFVHTMRLQFVEFFPKFFTGGGRDFDAAEKHINIFGYDRIRSLNRSGASEQLVRAELRQ